MGDYPTMTITADNKKRVVIPWVKPGDVFACEQQDENHFSLARLNPPPPPRQKKMTRAEGSGGPEIEGDFIQFTV